MTEAERLADLQRQHIRAARRLVKGLIEYPNARSGLEKQLAFHKYKAAQLAVAICSAERVATPAKGIRHLAVVG